MPTGEAAAQAGQKQASEHKRENQDKGPGSVAGNLTRDPELRYTTTGKPVAELGIACSERVRDGKTGDWKDGETVFFQVQAWGQLAENACEYLQRGDRVVAEGRWTSQAWEDKDGKMQERIVLTARDLGPSMMFRGAQIQRKAKEGSS